MLLLNIKLMEIIEICLKRVHMTRYELILKLDGALWVPKRANNTTHLRRARHYQNPLYQQKARAHM